MLEFMVIGLPRSGTTWAANWLMTGQTFCVHDPLWRHHYSDLDDAVVARAGGRKAGISCSGVWMWLDWVNAHPARKVIVHRDLADIRKSLDIVGMSHAMPDEDAPRYLKRIEGQHIHYDDLFKIDSAEAIWSFLTDGLPFDRERHIELTQTAVQPKFDVLQKNERVLKRLGVELSNSCSCS